MGQAVQTKRDCCGPELSHLEAGPQDLNLGGIVVGRMCCNHPLTSQMLLQTKIDQQKPLML